MWWGDLKGRGEGRVRGIQCCFFVLCVLAAGGVWAGESAATLPAYVVLDWTGLDWLEGARGEVSCANEPAREEWSLPKPLAFSSRLSGTGTSLRFLRTILATPAKSSPAVRYDY